MRASGDGSGSAPRGPEGVEIHPERPDDHAAIARVVGTAFGSSREARLVETIRGSTSYIAELSLVAEIGGEVVGHVMVSHAELRDADARHRVANLSPLAVLPRFQRRGVGSALVREATTGAECIGVPLVLLEGDPRFYARFGFESAAPHGIEFSLPSWAPPEAGQILRLSRYEATMRGRVVYPPAFEVVGDQ